MFQGSTYIVFRNIAMMHPVVCSFKEACFSGTRSVTLLQ